MSAQMGTLQMAALRRCRHWIVVGLAIFAGCNRSGLDLAPVEGVVRYNGQPLADAGVLFTPERGPMAMGVTDEQGRFSLTTANHPGALIGEHSVAISKAETLVRHVRGNAMPVYETKPLIPARYFDATTSQLSATVANQRNHFEFDLAAK